MSEWRHVLGDFLKSAILSNFRYHKILFYLMDLDPLKAGISKL